jgi:hypothetical protein
VPQVQNMATEAVPEEFLEQAYTVVSNEIGEDGPAELYALFGERYEAVGTAARNMTLIEAARKYGIALGREFFPVDAWTKEWAAREAAQRVAQVSEATRRGIAQIVAEGIWRQRGVDGTGRDIRPALLANDLGKKMGDYSGLTAQAIARCEKYAEQLIEDGYSDKQVEAMTKTFAKRRLKERGELIAQTEMRDAVIKGQLEQERRYGANEKRSRTVGDDRVSDTCRENAGASWIPIDAAFPSGHGGPSFHPRCRCRTDTRGMTEAELREKLRSEGVLGTDFGRQRSEAA